MDAEADIARERIARLARQLLRQERRVALLGTEREIELLASARRVAIDGIVALAPRAGDSELDGRCAALVAIYAALEEEPEQAGPEPTTRSRAVAALAELVASLPPPSMLGRLRAASHEAR